MTLRRISAAAVTLTFAAALILYPPYSFFFYLSPSRRLIFVFSAAAVSAASAALPLLPPKTRRDLGKGSVFSFAYAAVCLLLMFTWERSAVTANHAVTAWIIAAALPCARIFVKADPPEKAEKIIFVSAAALAPIQCASAAALWALTSAEIGMLAVRFMFPLTALISSFTDLHKPDRVLIFCAIRAGLIYRLSMSEQSVIILSCVLYAAFLAAVIYNLLSKRKRSTNHEQDQRDPACGSQSE